MAAKGLIARVSRRSLSHINLKVRQVKSVKHEQNKIDSKKLHTLTDGHVTTITSENQDRPSSSSNSGHLK